MNPKLLQQRHLSRLPFDARARLLRRAAEYEQHLREHPEDLLGRDPHETALAAYGLRDQPERPAPDAAIAAMPAVPREVWRPLLVQLAQAQHSPDVPKPKPWAPKTEAEKARNALLGRKSGWQRGRARGHKPSAASKAGFVGAFRGMLPGPKAVQS